LAVYWFGQGFKVFAITFCGIGISVSVGVHLLSRRFGVSSCWARCSLLVASLR
jgi:hypothetical protein